MSLDEFEWREEDERDEDWESEFLQLTEEYETWTNMSFEWSDRLGLRRAWIDMAGDHAGGVFLSQLVYWAVLPAKNSDEWTSRLSIERFGRKWLAKTYKEWWAECRLKPSQITRIVRSLRQRGLIETRIMKFRGSPPCTFR